MEENSWRLATDGGPEAITTPNIPMCNGGYEVGELEKQAVIDAINDKYIFRYYGPPKIESRVKKFEDEFITKYGVKYGLATNSFTSALIESLIALGVGPWDEVIVPGYSFFASCTFNFAAKAVPVIVEADDSLTIDPDDFERKFTSRTRVVIAVHMRATPCDMNRILVIAKRHNIIVLADVAQATGHRMNHIFSTNYGY